MNGRSGDSNSNSGSLSLGLAFLGVALCYVLLWHALCLLVTFDRKD
jgi:hypothetical protein